MKNLLLILTILGFQNIAFAQGWQRTLQDSLITKSTCKSFDGGYMVAGIYYAPNAQTFYKIIKIDAKGNYKWTKTFTDVVGTNNPFAAVNIIQSPDSTFILHGTTNVLTDYVIKKIDTLGNVIWSKKPYLTEPVLKADKTGYTITGKTFPPANIVPWATIIRLNLNGDTLAFNNFNGNLPLNFAIQKDGLLYVDEVVNGIYKMNINGKRIWSKSPSTLIFDGTNLLKQVIQAKDSNCYISSSTTVPIKIKSNGDTVWSKTLVSASDPLSNYALSNADGLISFPAAATNSLAFSKFDKNGTKIWSRNYDQFKKVKVIDILSCNEGGYLVVCDYDTENTNRIGTIFLIKMDENGLVYSNNLEGKIIKDINKNCQFNATDKPFKECLVEAKNNNGDTFWGLSDSMGRYAINLDSGVFTIKVYPLNNRKLWETCLPSVSRIFSSARRTDTLDFALKTIFDCPAMDVQITTPILRRCFENTYVVKYCNKGTIKADNAYITVTIDSLIEFVNASKAIASQTGRTYRFNLGTVAADDCGSFDITTRVRCGDSTRLGQTLCVEAKIFPDSICPPPSPLWSGANITVSGVCQRDSVLFQIRNTGTAASSQLTSIVIEDEVLFLREPIQLPQNGISTKKFPANGRTWRMVVNQEPNHPTSFNPTAFVEGCRANNNQPFNTGFALLFPNDDGGLVIDVDCRAIVGAYDPNDKAGYPIGYKTQRYIGQNQDIEYLVRFQNTGTDTAFTVVIRDTISEKLDISSIEFGASSHVYEAEIYGKGILKFTFNNIQLVDSFKNEPKSHGFVQYRIKQQKDLAVGSQIFNTAYIYFDFNEPVVTNRTLHTIGGKEVITAIFDKNAALYVPMKVSPNPFTSTALFETPLSINGNFELYDITGKALRKERFEGTTFAFQRKELAAGIYIFKIIENGRPLSIGKLIVQ
jgi:uncharacterized repeat protein (TIGR01451 family)